MVQDQSRTSTCWSFSALSFMESELLRSGKGKHNLSEMFVVRMAYLDKAEKYVRMHGTIEFGEGGAFHDIPQVIRRHGIVPEEVYKGLNYGEEKHNHREMESVLKGMLDAIIKNPQSTLTISWKLAFEAVLDAYLGKTPESFIYEGKTFTPVSFGQSLGLNMDDFIILSSFTHHPFYQSFIFEVPDNWAWGSVVNLPLNDFMEVIDHALLNGYTVGWAADVSEKGFNFKEGLAVVPMSDDQLKKKTDETAEKTQTIFDAPGPEKEVTQEMRQKAFDNYQTTDDHGMHITGMVKDQTGKKFYVVKNSWGIKNNDCDGYFYASEAYVRYKTMNIMLHKDAIQKEIKKKLGN
jgi:bleomycin hydrolase